LRAVGEQQKNVEKCNNQQIGAMAMSTTTMKKQQERESEIDKLWQQPQ